MLTGAIAASIASAVLIWVAMSRPELTDREILYAYPGLVAAVFVGGIICAIGHYFSERK